MRWSTSMSSRVNVIDKVISRCVMPPPDQRCSVAIQRLHLLAHRNLCVDPSIHRPWDHNTAPGHWDSETDLPAPIVDHSPGCVGKRDRPCYLTSAAPMLQAAKNRSESNLRLASLQADATAMAACRRQCGSMMESMYLASSSKCFLDILWLRLFTITDIIAKWRFLVNHKKPYCLQGFHRLVPTNLGTNHQSVCFLLGQSVWNQCSWKLRLFCGQCCICLDARFI